MNRVHAHHFWTWFRKHSNLLLALARMSAAEREYWLREIDTHLMACSGKLSFVLCCGHDHTGSLIITAWGKAKHFSMAEAVVAKAPLMPGWQVYSWQPAGLILPACGEPCIELTGPWFVPPPRRYRVEHIELSTMYVNEKGLLEVRK